MEQMISFSIPAYLYDFSQCDDGRTIAKLKVFYIGETADGRIIDEECAECLAKSIPYTPVVAFYSELKDDFIGHNSTQYVYGIVKPDAQYGFETDEDGVKWFVTEVMLYTDRNDNIGDIAKKIVGHAQSLEMNPQSVDYEVFKENGKTKIRFKKAEFLGLSVLGLEQKPAFTGSEFFNENEEIKDRFENFFSCLENRGVSMDKKEHFEQLLDFIKLNYNEKMRMVSDYAQAQFGNSKWVYIAEMNDSTCVLNIIDADTYNEEFIKYDYTIDEQGVTLVNPRATYRRYLSIQEIEKLDEEVSELEISQAEQSTEVKQEVAVNASEKGATDEQEKETTEEESNSTALSESEREEFETLKGQKEEFEQLKQANEQYAHDLEVKQNEFVELNERYTSQIQSFEELKQQIEKLTKENTQLNNEHKELEEFRLNQKVELVNSYKDIFDKDTLDKFLDVTKTMSYNELESKLALAFVKITKNQKQSKEIPFSFNSDFVEKPKTKQSSFAEAVNSILNK